jgi:hypothetical protein
MRIAWRGAAALCWNVRPLRPLPLLLLELRGEGGFLLAGKVATPDREGLPDPARRSPCRLSRQAWPSPAPPLPAGRMAGVSPKRPISLRPCASVEPDILERFQNLRPGARGDSCS